MVTYVDILAKPTYLKLLLNTLGTDIHTYTK